MSEPEVPAKSPAVLELGPGAYHWCACGRSANQPFCDGSHQGADFQPVEFRLEEEKRVALCLCKHTKTPPFCDGSHVAL